ncbi:MAG: NADH-quinone oxidoreductase subunit M [Magnetococcales bacterium]|nr:NADH-quinone oxidoreductase subunit M [Magnetococcales bacterium]
MENLPLISLLFSMFPVATIVLWSLRHPASARWIALTTTLLELGISFIILRGYRPEISGFQFTEIHPWIPFIHVYYRVGVDGISVLFLPLTAVLFLGAILTSWQRVTTMTRLYYTLLLFLKTVTFGIFCALDTILFFLFWELALVPIYFLISLWGAGPHRRYSAVQYTLLMIASGIPLLLAIILLAIDHAHSHQSGLLFSLPDLLASPATPRFQTLLFFLLLAGLAPKVPLVPFHVWLPTMAREGPAVVLAFMSGVKLGAYGIIRLLLPLAPVAAQDYHWLLAGMGTAGLLYGAFLALSQTNLLMLLAYASISHVGLVLLGIASLNLTGIQGAVFQLINFSLIASSLFFLTSFLQHRIQTTEAVNLGGIASSMPLLASFFLFFGLASMGLPGTCGFPAEFLLLMSALKTHSGAGLAALATMILAAGYFLNLFRKSFLGQTHHQLQGPLDDLLPRELAILLMLATPVILFGLFPQPILDHIAAATIPWVERLAQKP